MLRVRSEGYNQARESTFLLVRKRNGENAVFFGKYAQDNVIAVASYWRGLLATPLLLWHAFKNRQLKPFIFYSSFIAAIENIPFLFYFNIGQSFINTNSNLFVASQFFHYEWILIYSVLALSISEITAAKNYG
jgi:hypothetical protein